MSKKLTYSIIIILVAVVVAVVIVKYKDNAKKPEGKPLPLPPNLDIKEYGLSGKVTAISGNKITLNVGRVYTGNDGNFVNYEDKKVTVSPDTKISLITKSADGKYLRSPATVSDIVVGTEITTYSDKNIRDLGSYTPTRIDIFKP